MDVEQLQNISFPSHLSHAKLLLFFFDTQENLLGNFKWNFLLIDTKEKGWNLISFVPLYKFSNVSFSTWELQLSVFVLKNICELSLNFFYVKCILVTNTPVDRLLISVVVRMISVVSWKRSLKRQERSAHIKTMMFFNQR